MEENVLKYYSMENRKAANTLLDQYNYIQKKHPG